MSVVLSAPACPSNALASASVSASRYGSSASASGPSPNPICTACALPLRPPGLYLPALAVYGSPANCMSKHSAHRAELLLSDIEVLDGTYPIFYGQLTQLPAE